MTLHSIKVTLNVFCSFTIRYVNLIIAKEALHLPSTEILQRQ